MKICTLMENKAVSEEFTSSHGLSFYIETKNHRILFDMGPDGSFLENAKKLGIDISGVDFAILSHGHYDHGGGLKAFLEANQRASVHIQKKALGSFWAHDPDGSLRYIGLPKGLEGNPRIVCHTGDYKLGVELQVFAGVTGRECYSPANDSLFMEMNGHHVQDLFMHEQNLIIKEGNLLVLIAGCAHNGIVNILNKAEHLAPEGIDYVLGGMHLRKAYGNTQECEKFCSRLAGRLMKKSCRYYTCHCTGEEPYQLLHREMGERMQYLAAGSVLELAKN